MSQILISLWAVSEAPTRDTDLLLRRRTGQALQRCMDAKSSIVTTIALEGLADLTVQEPSLIPLTLDLLMSAERNGTPAVKARSRELLHKLNRSVNKLDPNSH